MSNITQAATAVESPCINICNIHPTARICIGCYRSIEEISAWGSMAPHIRQRIIQDLKARAELLEDLE